jgi:hypothetical protein
MLQLWVVLRATASRQLRQLSASSRRRLHRSRDDKLRNVHANRDPYEHSHTYHYSHAEHNADTKHNTHDVGVLQLWGVLRATAAGKLRELLRSSRVGLCRGQHMCDLHTDGDFD